MQGIGVPLIPGNYLLSMSIANQDLKKIGTQYFEFSLPIATSFTDSLETTPLFFIKKIENIDTPETKPFTQKGYFTYSILKIEPNFESVFSSGDFLEFLFYVFGAQPKENGKFDFEKSLRWLHPKNQNCELDCTLAFFFKFKSYVSFK